MGNSPSDQVPFPPFVLTAPGTSASEAGRCGSICI